MIFSLHTVHCVQFLGSQRLFLNTRSVKIPNRQIFCELTVGDNILIDIGFRKGSVIFLSGGKRGFKRGERKSSRPWYQTSPTTQIEIHILIHLRVYFVLISTTCIMHNL